MDEFMDCETGIEIVDLAEKYWLTSDRILCVEKGSLAKSLGQWCLSTKSEPKQEVSNCMWKFIKK